MLTKELILAHKLKHQLLIVRKETLELTEIEEKFDALIKGIGQTQSFLDGYITGAIPVNKPLQEGTVKIGD